VEIMESTNRPMVGRNLPYSSQKHYCWSQIAHSGDLKVVRVKQREADVRNSNTVIFLGTSSLY